jgi:hypothetical protein
MKSIIAIALGFVLLATAWVVNLNQLIDCDYDAPYKCEIVHGIGLVIPIASLATVWVGDDS